MSTALLMGSRHDFHRDLRSRLWSRRAGVPSNSDKDNGTSVRIGLALAEAVGVSLDRKRLSGSAAGTEFERRTKDFLAATFPRLEHLRPGVWRIKAGAAISRFEQYAHLDALERASRENAELAAALGSDYTIKPDIIVTREAEPDERINRTDPFVDEKSARFTPLRSRNSDLEILHASVSCKWTIRSDRTQNSRAEALNLLRNRKGRAPHIAVVTAEPLPSRLASIAIGTGDIDCTYHVALHELRAVVQEGDWGDAEEMLAIMIDGKRLRDISDLPLDLAI